jgi:hypothetical protein
MFLNQAQSGMDKIDTSGDDDPPPIQALKPVDRSPKLKRMTVNTTD